MDDVLYPWNSTGANVCLFPRVAHNLTTEDLGAEWFRGRPDTKSGSRLSEHSPFDYLKSPGRQDRDKPLNSGLISSDISTKDLLTYSSMSDDSRDEQAGGLDMDGEQTTGG